jgi:hypothetical protein
LHGFAGADEVAAIGERPRRTARLRETSLPDDDDISRHRSLLVQGEGNAHDTKASSRARLSQPEPCPMRGPTGELQRESKQVNFVPSLEGLLA